MADEQVPDHVDETKTDPNEVLEGIDKEKTDNKEEVPPQSEQ